MSDSDVNEELEKTGKVDDDTLGRARIEHDEGAQPQSPRGRASRVATDADNLPDHGDDDPATSHPGGVEAADPPSLNT
ncbi:hypothetical protein OG394_01415 [Kribbella sp. NBC_01245]|uniref:hypothetical protein n=1 Tax=Kribbella sp. NBC_01245 TaxID=2903578 RepID=UPI002E2C07BB|nr:hypothetical protein [Kribbella sp. NBC_01245]